MNAIDNPKGKKFLDAIAKVCSEHGLVLTVELYDGLQVWPWDEQGAENIRNAEWRGEK